MFLATLAALSWLGWRMLTLGMAAYFSHSAPARALAWRADFADARLRAFETGEPVRAATPANAALARESIRAAPLDGRGYWWLGRIAEASADERGAEAMYRVSARRGPRNTRVLGWLLDREFRAGEFRAGVAHLDQLLRVQPELSRYLYPAVFRLALDPAAQPALVAVLARRPPWRADLMPMLIAQSPDVGPLRPFIERLRRDPSGLDDAELAAWIDRLGNHDHDWGAAYLVWTQSLRPEEAIRIGNVFNGGFENPPSNSGFDWRFERIPGAHVSRSESAEGSRYSLQVDFEDRRVAFQHVRQLLALAPGSYRLRGRSRLDLRSDRGLVWSIFCADDGRLIGETQPMQGRHPWQAFEADFEVPAEQCGGQWLTLRIPARIAAEQLAGGSANFDDLKIKRLPK